MKLLFLIPGQSFGGLEIQMIKRANDSKNLGHEYLLICSENTRISKMAIELNLKCKYLDLNKNYIDIFYINNLRKTINSFKPDSIITGTTKLLTQIYVALLFSNISPKVFLYQQMQSGINKKDPIHNYIYKRLNGAVVLTPQMKQMLIDTTIMKSDTIQVIPYGLEIDKYRGMREEKEKLREKFNLPLNKKIIGIIARFDEHKNHITAINALNFLVQNDKNISLVFAGSLDESKEYLNYLHLKINEYNLNDNIIFLPFTNDIPELMNCFDIFLLPTRAETFGLVIIEAMACELPVIAGNGGGVPAIIDDEVNGLLFKAEDSFELANKINKLLLNSEFANQLSQNAREKVKKNYEYNTQVKTFFDFITQSLN